MTVKTVCSGLLAGTAGVAAMTLSEKLEQTLTQRPDSYTPGHVLQRLTGQPLTDTPSINWTMHWGLGILMGTVRALMAEAGVRGPFGTLLHLNLRLATDQTLENTTGVSRPPWTWPLDEQVVDILHKGVYAVVTGPVADALVQSSGTVPEPMKPWNQR